MRLRAVFLGEPSKVSEEDVDMGTIVKKIDELIQDDAAIPPGWRASAIVNDDNLTYVIWNEDSREAIVTDPMREDWKTLLSIAQNDLKSYRFTGVIDTHTHADHISCAAALANELNVPLIQHMRSPSQRIHLRICRDTVFQMAAAPMRFLTTPGHTEDGVTLLWGPFIVSGDTLLYGDTGRDDLPGGNAEAHWESLQKIKTFARPEMLMLPGHDLKGGRVSSWEYQLKISPALSQDKATFLKDGGAWTGPAPKHMEECLFENSK